MELVPSLLGFLLLVTYLNCFSTQNIIQKYKFLKAHKCAIIKLNVYYLQNSICFCFIKNWLKTHRKLKKIMKILIQLSLLEICVWHLVRYLFSREKKKLSKLSNLSTKNLTFDILIKPAKVFDIWAHLDVNPPFFFEITATVSASWCDHLD